MTIQNAGYHRINIGDIAVTAIHDGTAPYTTDILVGIDRPGAEAMLHAAHRPAPPIITISAFLVQTGKRTILIDTGIGSERGDGIGFLARRLEAMGVPAASVDTVLLTHMHVDHSAGLLDASGAARFPNASLAMHENERNFWLDEARAAAPPEAIKHVFELAARVTKPYRDRITAVAAGEVAPGISIEHLPGHTPGHSGYLIQSGADALLIWGDIVHMPAIQFANPDVGLSFDVDGEQARHTRRNILERASHDRLRVAGMHHEFPTFGYIDKAATGFAFVPEFWTA